MTPTPYPPASPVTATDWALLAFMFTLAFLSYWLPTILAIWRRNSRMGLVIFYNLGAFMVVPWMIAMGVVFGEHSRRVRPPMWTPPPADWQGPPTTTPQTRPDVWTAAHDPAPSADLPPNVTQLRRERGTPC